MLSLNGAYQSELFRPTLNHKFSRAQVKLTRACALVGPAVDTPLYTIGMMLGRDTVCVPTKSAGERNYLKQWLTS